MKRKNSERVRQIAVAGVLLALILIFLLVPLAIGPLSLAVVAVLAVIIACEFEGLGMGLFAGLAFGVTSLIASFTTGAGSPTAVIFHNPLVSILPRVIIPLTCYFSYKGIRLAFKRSYDKKENYDPKAVNRLSISVASIVGAVVATVTNTALVMGMLFAFNAGKTFGNVYIGTAMLVSTLSVNFPIELGVCAAVSAPLMLALHATFHSFDKDGLSPVPKNAVKDASNEQVQEQAD
jgi:uncharacterized membrane protein